jgi:hypothetical protein
MEQTIEGLRDMYGALLAIRRRLESRNPRMFALLAEGPVDEIRRLKRELDLYAGVTRAKQLASHKPRRKAVARSSRRQAAR